MTIHPTAFIDPAARIGGNVAVGPYTIVHPNVVIGDDSVIGSHCEIGHPSPRADGSPLIIGERALIRSHSVFYEGSRFGPELKTGHRVIALDGVVAGKGFQFGTGSELQGDCEIGDYVRFQSGVIIGRQSRIGNFVWMFPRTGMMNDPTPPSDTFVGATIDDFAVICSYSILMSGVRVGTGGVIGAMSTVSRNVAPHSIASGNPLVMKGPTSRLRLKGSRLPAYPWTRHFHRGYPSEVVSQWLKEAIDTLP